MRRFIFLFLIIWVTISYSNTLYEKWKIPGYFRGYNVLYESPKNLQDFLDLKYYGGNLFHIGVWGFFNEDPPYAEMTENIQKTDELVSYCRGAGMYYVLAIRSGPGAYDTYQESNGSKPESRIWESKNLTEQYKYSEMLKMIVDRYDDDTLFVGINLLIEPRPKVKYIPANNSATYKYFLEKVYNIHMDQVYDYWISDIRNINTNIPVIVENFGYSTPELFPGYLLSDSYVIYSTHLYMPKEYTNAQTPYSMTYPGTYWNLTYLAQKYYDYNFLKNTVLSKVIEFQNTSETPVLLGEFGMFKPQIGGSQYLNDVLIICKENGWNFALWDWRRGSGQNWNIEFFEGDDNQHWKTILSFFNAPPVPEIISPDKYAYIYSDVVDFSWDKLTSFTLFDIQILKDNELIDEITDIKGNTIRAKLKLEKGIEYTWRIRSKNPGGKPGNASAWSEDRILYIPVPEKPSLIIENKKFELDNYPNPFNPKTYISYQIINKSNVNLRIFNIEGKEIAVLQNSKQNSGTYKVEFDASAYPSGVYFIILDVIPDGSTSMIRHSKKIILTR